MNPSRLRMRSRGRGFTLIELMVTVAILAILSMVAAPSFNEAILSNKLTSYANTFVSSTQLARSEAIKRNATVVLCRSADGASCATSGNWQQGWIVWRDTNANGTVDVNEVIQWQQPLSIDYHFTGNAYSLDFLATGAAQITGGALPPVALTLCRATPSMGGQERTVRLTATGRTSVEKTRVGDCP
jgi:type IV fimbrial biogenesis protein FimT